VQERLEGIAREFEQHAPVPRVALYDVAFPKDKEEYKALNKHAVLLVTVVTQDPAELPIKRVYVRASEEDRELAMFLSPASATPAGLVREVLGPYRQDAYYLLPIASYFEPGQLLLDFAENRVEFLVTEYPRDLPVDLVPKEDSLQPEPDITVPPEKILEVIGREFLGITIEFEPAKP